MCGSLCPYESVTPYRARGGPCTAATAPGHAAGPGAARLGHCRLWPWREQASVTAPGCARGRARCHLLKPGGSGRFGLTLHVGTYRGRRASPHPGYSRCVSIPDFSPQIPDFSPKVPDFSPNRISYRIFLQTILDFLQNPVKCTRLFSAFWWSVRNHSS
jgi:hypothetical protein